MYPVMWKDGKGCSEVGSYMNKQDADRRVASIGEHQRMNGAYHVIHYPGLARCFFRDGTVTEVWRGGVTP